MRNIWEKIVAWVLGIPVDKRLHFVAGVIVSTFFALAFGMRAALVPAVVAGFTKEFIDAWQTGSWDWGDFFATVLGGVLVQVFVLLGIWWGFLPA